MGLLFAGKPQWKKQAGEVRVAERPQGRNDLFIPAQRGIATVDVL